MQPKLTFAKTAAAGLLAAILIGPGAAYAASPETTLVLGISGLSEGKLPIYVAREKNYLKDAGINVQFEEFQSGGAVVQAFVGRGVDFCICAADHAILLHDRGLDVKLMVALDSHSPNVLAAKPGAKVSSLADLKGLKIGITSPGSSTDNLIRWALRRAKLDPDKDVQLVSVGTGPTMQAAIASGSVDAGILGNAELIEAETRDVHFKIIADFRTTPNAQLNVIGWQTWIDAHPQLAKAFVQAVARGAKTIQSDPSSAVAAVKQIFPNKPETFYKAIAASAAQHLSKDGAIDPNAYENVTEIVSQADPTAHRVDLKDLNAEPTLSTPSADHGQ